MCMRGHHRANTILNGFWKLDGLRHVYMRWSARLPLPPAAYMPEGTTMWNLQTLYGVTLDQTKASLFSNNIFPNSRTLGLEYKSQKDNNKALFSRFSKKKTDETSISRSVEPHCMNY
ncbi:hypothetical protein PIB30_040676 [Stylosanthes scabra]|uniref:Uncharacterized protein n=1 Tax=Stylosanthes scabra TaxID=79078 RepID=A0ABU6QEA2_9FABA|nr:hypothetical protein [Stylosanthes scabra]